MPSRPRAAIAALVLVLLLPAAAGAATATVTGDAGQAVALSDSGVVRIRNMSPTVVPSYPADTKRYSITVLAPDGKTDAGLGQRCQDLAGRNPGEAVTYQGNGTYTVTTYETSNPDDFNCEQGTQQTFRFEIAATTTLKAPATTLLQRAAGDTISHRFQVGLVPGAGGYGVYAVPAGTIGANGGLIGSGYAEYDVDKATGIAAVSFGTTGKYTLNANAFGSGGATPFTAPVYVKVIAPLEFQDKPYLKDSRGPGYQIVGKIIGDEADGKTITISCGRGTATLKKLGSPRIGPGGSFSLRFKQTKRGRYKCRAAFKGAEYMQAGTVTTTVTLR